MKRFIVMTVITAFILAVSAPICALSDSLGGTFIDNGVAARPAGMGGAFTAIANDANASWWNPAGLGLLGKDKSLSFTYVPQLYELAAGNISKIFLTYGQGDMSGYGGIGGTISYVSINMGADYTGDSEPTWQEYVLVFSWGMQIDKYIGLVKYKYPKVSFGVNVKYLGVSTELTVDGAETGASGFGFDAGLIVAFKGNLAIGVMAKNIYNTVTWTGGSSERMPYQINGGAYYGLTNTFIISGEIKSTESDSGTPKIDGYCAGLEYVFEFGKRAQIQALAVRGGFSMDPNEESYILSGGASMTMDTFSIDYAYQYYMQSDLNQYTHRLGLTAYF